MNELAKINRAKTSTAEEIKDEIAEIYLNCDGDKEDFYFDIMRYINKEHLFKSE